MPWPVTSASYHNPSAIRQALPIIEITTYVIGRVTPTGNLESGNLRLELGQERLLNGLGNLQFVFDLLQLSSCLCFAQRGLHVRSDFGSDAGRQHAGAEHEERKIENFGLRDREAVCYCWQTLCQRPDKAIPRSRTSKIKCQVRLRWTAKPD